MDGPKFSGSTTTEVQLAKLLELLRMRPHHTHELRARGISHPAGRVRDPIERGYVIESSRVTTVDSYAFTNHGVAMYSLVADPPQCGLDFGREAANDDSGGTQK